MRKAREMRIAKSLIFSDFLLKLNLNFKLILDFDKVDKWVCAHSNLLKDLKVHSYYSFVWIESNYEAAITLPS